MFLRRGDRRTSRILYVFGSDFVGCCVVDNNHSAIAFVNDDDRGRLVDDDIVCVSTIAAIRY